MIDFAYNLFARGNRASIVITAMRHTYPMMSDDLIFAAFDEAFDRWRFQEAPRLMGARRSEAKAEASRINGRKSPGPKHPNGGRPKGSKNKGATK